MQKRRSPLPGQWARSFRTVGKQGATGFKRMTDDSATRTKRSMKRYSS